MRKIAFIIISTLLYYGCAVSKRNAKTAGDDFAATLDNIHARIIEQNITGRSFFIERAEFRISGPDGVKSGIGTIKFLMPDRFLISIKSIIGIEVARILLKGDSVFINDRFNKKLYYGSTSYLKDKYGVTTALLPVVMGDYVNEKRLDRDKVKCQDGKMNLTGVVNNTKIKYLIDCNIAKVLRLLLSRLAMKIHYRSGIVSFSDPMIYLHLEK